METSEPNIAVKEPWLAALLSMLLPGLGQYYAGRKKLGVALAILHPASFIGAMYFLCADGPITVYGLALIPLCAALSFFTWIHAFFSTRSNNDVLFERERRSQKDPWLSVFLSFLFPSLGHFYLRHWLHGILAFVAWVAVTTFVSYCFELEPHPIFQIAAFFVSIHAYTISHALRPSRVRNPHRIVLAYWAYAYLLILTLTSIRTYVVEPFAISGRSMAPTFVPGDRMLVWKRFNPNLQRGTLVTYLNPESQMMFVKRLVAIGGERVEIKDDGRLYINNQPLTAAPFDATTYNQYSPPNEKKTFWVVPQDSIFVVGDNPTLSLDSRQSGPILLRSVTGIAYKIWWPLDRAGPIK